MLTRTCDFCKAPIYIDTEQPIEGSLCKINMVRSQLTIDLCPTCEEKLEFYVMTRIEQANMLVAHHG